MSGEAENTVTSPDDGPRCPNCGEAMQRAAVHVMGYCEPSRFWRCASCYATRPLGWTRDAPAEPAPAANPCPTIPAAAHRAARRMSVALATNTGCTLGDMAGIICEEMEHVQRVLAHERECNAASAKRLFQAGADHRDLTDRLAAAERRAAEAEREAKGLREAGEAVAETLHRLASGPLLLPRDRSLGLMACAKWEVAATSNISETEERHA